MLNFIKVARESNDAKRVYVRPSDEMVRYLDDLVGIGIHGKTRSEVAKTLLQSSVERLIKDGLLKLRTSSRPR